MEVMFIFLLTFEVLHECDFVSFRGLLRKIAGTPYASEGWEFAAIRRGGVIFLCERDTEEKKLKTSLSDFSLRNSKISDRERLLTYWGFKFEQYMTTEKPNVPPNTNDKVTNLEEFCVVVRSALAAPNGELMKLVYGGEVDAINENGELVELKTQRHALEGSFWNMKSLSWWLQSFLIGIEYIIIGFRDDSGIVKNVDFCRVEDLPKDGKWNSGTCLNALSSVLSVVRSQLSSDGLACIVNSNPKNKRVYLKRVPLHDADFLTRDFLSHFGLE